MPRIDCCRRRVWASSDDFVGPAIVMLMSEALWIVAAAAAIAYIYAVPSTCENDFSGFIIAYLAFRALCGIVDVLLLRESSKGALAETQKRRRVGGILGIRTLLTLGDVCAASAGVFRFLAAADRCLGSEGGFDIETFVAVTLWFNWVISATGLLWVVGALACGSDAARSHVYDPSDHLKNRSATRWAKRCGYCRCFCKLAKADLEVFETIGNVMAHVFEPLERLSWTMTDVAAGLTLVAFQQQFDEHLKTPPAVRQSCFSSVRQFRHTVASSRSIDFTDPAQKEAVTDAWRFRKQALGAYGAPLFLFMHPLCGCPRLSAKRCSMGCSGVPAPTSGDCSRCNEAALRLQTGHDPSSFRMLHLVNRPFSSPFFVAVDTDSDTTVIAVRGTMSLSDVLTDAVAEPICVSEHPAVAALGVGGAGFVHKGMWQTALTLAGVLDQAQLFPGAGIGAIQDPSMPMNSAPEPGLSTPLGVANHDNHDRRVVVVGHSLGAGVATLLAILLKRVNRTVTCIAYSPPAAICSPELSEAVVPFVTSVVLGKDLVPRMSIASIQTLMLKLVLNSRDTKASKSAIFWRSLRGKPMSRDEFYAPGQAPACEMRAVMTNVANQLQRAAEKVLIGEQRAEDYDNGDEVRCPQGSDQTQGLTGSYNEYHRIMSIPGRVLHVTRSEARTRCCRSRVTHQMHWAVAEDFTDVIVSKHMIYDHMPDAVMAALDQAAQLMGVGSM